MCAFVKSKFGIIAHEFRCRYLPSSAESIYVIRVEYYPVRRGKILAAFICASAGKFKMIIGPQEFFMNHPFVTATGAIILLKFPIVMSSSRITLQVE